MRDELPGLPYRFSDPGLLREALTHRSRDRRHNERLEFLGDSVLNFVVSERLFALRPQATEGDLSRLRARVVRGETLARMAKRMELGQHLRLGEGEMKSGGHRRSSILADTLEALFGAILLDGGYEACRDAILALCDPVMMSLPDAESLKDAKTRLQEFLQARGRPRPEYSLVGESGADHDKRFEVTCRLTDSGAAMTAVGTSRRKAEQAAAAAMLAAEESI